MKLTPPCVVALVLATGCAAPAPTPPPAKQNVRRKAPRLVLQITVDQLRGDLPRRYYDRLGPGGFRYLMENGTVYEDARHRHSNTETIVGHTTLATGADPASHGMIGNMWLDRATGRMGYNVEDARYPLLSKSGDVDDKTEIDPTQKAARSSGRSPAAILTSTFSDELSLFTGHRSKVFGVSVKDRGAISLAGHTGKAFWFSKASGEFVTSRFYYDKYPAWVADFNAQKPTQKYSETSWELSRERSSYLFGDRDDRPYETALGSFKRTFPHPYGKAGSKYFTTFLTLSPAGDELTLEFAKALIKNEGLGKDDVPDYLSVSFSATDYVGHIFGPSSLESEDNLLRLDRTLAALLEYVDQTVGLDNTLIVLSADHGGIEAPGYLKELGFDADYVEPKAWDKADAIAALKKRFGIGKALIKTFSYPYIYLDRKAIKAKGLDLAEVEEAVAAEVSKLKGVEVAVGSTRLTRGEVPNTALYRSILRSHHAQRSGDIYVGFKPNYFINDFDGLVVASTHGSAWGYDRYVPIMFAGPGIRAQRVVRRVETVDVALTLSLLTGAKPPNAAAGKALHEVFGD